MQAFEHSSDSDDGHANVHGDGDDLAFGGIEFEEHRTAARIAPSAVSQDGAAAGPNLAQLSAADRSATATVQTRPDAEHGAHAASLEQPRYTRNNAVTQPQLLPPPAHWSRGGTRPTQDAQAGAAKRAPCFVPPPISLPSLPPWMQQGPVPPHSASGKPLHWATNCEATGVSAKLAPAAASDEKSQLHHELVRFAQLATPTSEEATAVQQGVAAVAAVAQGIWPQSVTTLFGSQATGLALPGADLDIVILGSYPELDSPGSGYSLEARKIIADLLKDLHDSLLRTRPVVLKGAAKIIAARIPIIKCYLAAGGGMPADISIGVQNGACAVVYITRQLAALPPLRPLILAVKAFLLQQGLNEVFTGGISSYTIANMCMAHLQAEGIAIADGSPATDQDAAAGDLRCSLPAAAAIDLGYVLRSFLQRFGHDFRYERDAVAVRQGGIVAKWPAWKQRGRDWLLAVEDPQDAGKDIGSGSFNIRQVKNLFREAAIGLSVPQSAAKQPPGLDPEDDSAAWARVQADGEHRSVPAPPAFPVLGMVVDITLSVGRDPAAKAKRDRAASAQAAAQVQGRQKKNGKFRQANARRKEARALAAAAAPHQTQELQQRKTKNKKAKQRRLQQAKNGSVVIAGAGSDAQQRKPQRQQVSARVASAQQAGKAALKAARKAKAAARKAKAAGNSGAGGIKKGRVRKRRDEQQ